MIDAVGIFDRLVDMGISARVDGERLFLSPVDRVPPEMLAAVRENKTEIITRLQHRKELIDLPWPVGYGGLPESEVARAESHNDRLEITDPVNRRLNVLVWLRGYFQDARDSEMSMEMRQAYHELRHADPEIQGICGICEFQA